MARPLLRATACRLPVRPWGLERPRPRFVPRLAAALGVDPVYLLDVDPNDPPLAALRLAAGRATNEVTAPGLSVMTYVRLEDGRPGADPPIRLISAIAEVLCVDVPRVEAAVRRSRSDHAALASFGG